MGERFRRYSRYISPFTGKPGVIAVGDERLKNPTKRHHVPSEDLQNLQSLAIIATNRPGDSFDYSYLDDAQNKAERKYNSEQSQEIWRTTLASLMSRDFSLPEIAEDLMYDNEKIRTSIRLGTLKPEEKLRLQSQLINALGRYWPSAKQVS